MELSLAQYCETRDAVMKARYEEIRSTSAELAGLTSDLVRSPEYIIALRHQAEVTGSLSDFAEHLAQFVPCIRYDATNLHTTLATLKPPLSNAEFPDDATLSRLSNVAEAVLEPHWRRIAIEYRGWLLAKDAVLVEGHPSNNAFWQSSLLLCSIAKEYGVPDLKSAWGAHITASRFTEFRPIPDARQLLQLLKDGPMLSSGCPLRIDIGWCECSAAGFFLHAMKSLQI